MGAFTLMTFLLECPRSVHQVELLGSWDNFSKPYVMKRDLRRGSGHWSGCYSFSDVICDGDIHNLSPRRNGGLRMGGLYWYYYRLDNMSEFHDPTQPSTTSCPLMPGQRVNVLDVPYEDSPGCRSRSSSTSSVASGIHTLNPDDKYATPTPPEPLNCISDPFKLQDDQDSQKDHAETWSWENMSLYLAKGQTLFNDGRDSSAKPRPKTATGRRGSPATPAPAVRFHRRAFSQGAPIADEVIMSMLPTTKNGRVNRAWTPTSIKAGLTTTELHGMPLPSPVLPRLSSSYTLSAPGTGSSRYSVTTNGQKAFSSPIPFSPSTEWEPLPRRDRLFIGQQADPVETTHDFEYPEDRPKGLNLRPFGPSSSQSVEASRPKSRYGSPSSEMGVSASPVFNNELLLLSKVALDSPFASPRRLSGDSTNENSADSEWSISFHSPVSEDGTMQSPTYSLHTASSCGIATPSRTSMQLSRSDEYFRRGQDLLTDGFGSLSLGSEADPDALHLQSGAGRSSDIGTRPDINLSVISAGKPQPSAGLALDLGDMFSQRELFSHQDGSQATITQPSATAASKPAASEDLFAASATKSQQLEFDSNLENQIDSLIDDFAYLGDAVL